MRQSPCTAIRTAAEQAALDAECAASVAACRDRLSRMTAEERAAEAKAKAAEAEACLAVYLAARAKALAEAEAMALAVRAKPRRRPR